MKLNEKSALLIPEILLVPYSPHHVPTYHRWMQDPALQVATASEPLTLDQEYAMQKSWRTDADKLTFIACTTPTPPSASASTTQSNDPAASPLAPFILAEQDDTPATMIGDINLFLTPSDEEDEENKLYQSVMGEVEIMIASKAHQGQGLGRRILLTFLWYIAGSLDAIMSEYHSGHSGGKTTSQMEYLRVKIDKNNARSIALFSSVGFSLLGAEPNYFGELELRLCVSPGLKGEVETRLEEVPRVLEYKIKKKT